MPDLWPYVPMPDIRESVVWQTNVIRSGNDEMRFSLNDGMQRFQYDFSLSARFQEAAALLRANPYGPWDVPVWHQSSKAGPVSPSDTSLTVDLNAEYTDRAVIFGGCDDYIIADISSITTTLNLSAPVGRAFTNPTVAPLRSCLLPTGASISKALRNNVSLQMEFLSQEDFPASGSGYQVLDALPYLKCSVAILGPLSGMIRHPVTVIDNGYGPPVLVESRNVLDHTYSVTVAHSDTGESKAFRAFLGDIRGRDGAFWIADWEGVLGSALNGATSLDFQQKALDPTDYVDRFLSFGAEVRVVRTATDLGGGAHRVTFDAITADAPVVRFLRKVRLDTDTINFTHRRGLASRASFSVIEVTE